jgi:NADPH2:quinone reductase
VADVLEATDGKGADLAVDLAGGDRSSMSKLITAIRDRGPLAVVGAASGEPPTIGFWHLIAKRLTVYGVASAADLHLAPTQAKVWEYTKAAAAGALRLPIDKEFPLARAADAHRYIETEHPFGRVLLIP